MGRLCASREGGTGRLCAEGQEDGYLHASVSTLLLKSATNSNTTNSSTTSSDTGCCSFPYYCE